MTGHAHRNAAIRSIVFAFLTIVGVAFAQKHYTELEYPKLGDIQIPEVQRVTLDNGMKLFILEDHELPLIDVAVRIDARGAYDPPDKIGLAEITGTVMRTGGTQNMTGDEIDEKLESMAASIEVEIGLLRGIASMSVLKEDIDVGLSMLADILMNPAFDEDKIELAKMQMRTSIARRNDDPAEIASREFWKLIYGSDSVYARHPEYATVNNITRDDLIEFHDRYFHPNNVMLGIWGDFETEEMIEKIKKAFGGWESREIEFPVIPQVEYEYRPTVNYVEKNDVNQTSVLIGHIGVKMDDPDYFALIILNRILGSGSTSRLYKNVRVEKGLAYSVYGGLSAYFDFPGVFYVGCQTKSETTVQAIRAMIEEIRRITQDEVTDEELELAKNAYLNSFVFNFDTTGEVINRLMVYEYYGYPSDFLIITKNKVEQLTKADILRAARRHLRPESLQILAVGRGADFDEPLSVFGEVNQIDITIPTPVEARPEPTIEEAALGRELLLKSVEACGGSEAFARIENYRAKGQLTISGAQGDISMDFVATVVLPDKLHQMLSTPLGEIKQVLVGDSGWMVTGQGTVDMDEAQIEDSRANMFRDYVNLFKNASSDKIAVQFIGDDEFNGKPTKTLLISRDKYSVILSIDAETFIPVKQDYQAQGPAGLAKWEKIYSDIRVVDGIKFPFSTQVNMDGERYVASTVEGIEFNVEIAPDLFIRESATPH